MSLPYHVANGIFGGFLPLIAASRGESTHNPYMGLAYPIGVTLLTVIVGGIALPKVTADADLRA